MQKGAADQGEVGHQIGIAAAGAVFAAKGIAAPVVAIFYSAPVAADEVDPAFVRALRRLLTGEGLANACSSPNSRWRW